MRRIGMPMSTCRNGFMLLKSVAVAGATGLNWTQLREHLDSTVQRWQKEEQKHCGRSICKHVKTCYLPGRENGLRICNYPKLSILISINLRSILHTISLAEMNRPRTTLASPSKHN